MLSTPPLNVITYMNTIAPMRQRTRVSASRGTDFTAVDDSNRDVVGVSVYRTHEPGAAVAIASSDRIIIVRRISGWLATHIIIDNE